MDHNKDGCGPGSTQKMEWLIVIEEDLCNQDKFSCAAVTDISPNLNGFNIPEFISYSYKSCCEST